MRKIVLHSVTLFLAFALLFTQTAIGFLHDKHDAHEEIEQAHRNQTELHKHGEHCKICAIDLFHSLFIEGEFTFKTLAPSSVVVTSHHNDHKGLPIDFARGRAPPASKPS